MAYIGNSPDLNESVDTAQLKSPLTGDLGLGADADGTDRILTFGHSTLKSVIGIDDSADIFAINTDDAFEAANDLEIDASGNVTISNGDLSVGDDASLTSDSSVFNMGAGNDFTMTHDGTTGITLAATPISINSTGDLTLDSTTDIVLDAAGGNFEFKDAGTTQLTIDVDGTAGDIDVNLNVNGDDLVFNQYDGTEVMRLGDGGEVTMPSQPAFHVHPASAQTNIATGGVTIVYGTERFDVGSNFASNTFTAPIGGKYFLQVSIQLRNVDTASAYYVTSLITSNKTYEFTFDPGMSEGEGDWNAWNWEFSTIADMDASDTAYVTLNQETGTAQSDINVAGTWFSGCLVC